MSPREIIDWTLRESGYGDLATLESGALARSSAAVRGGALPRRLRLSGRKVSLQGGLDATRRSPTTDCAAPGARCRACPTTGRSTRTPTRIIRSSSRPRRRAISSIRASPRRRPRVRANSGPRCSSTRPTRRGWGSQTATSSQLGNERGRTRLHARIFDGASPGVLVSEGVWPPSAFLDGWGINALVGDDSVAPFGGVAFHDVSVGRAEHERRAPYRTFFAWVGGIYEIPIVDEHVPSPRERNEMKKPSGTQTDGSAQSLVDSRCNRPARQDRGAIRS